MNHKNLSRKTLKGFTLIELIVVIAIIVVLTGISSLAINGFRRDARIQTNNNKAEMIFSTFQDILIDCEINQDLSMFDVREFNGVNGDITGAVLFFRISDMASNGMANLNNSTGLGDEIHIMTSYKQTFTGGIAPNVASGSVWMHGTSQNVSSQSGYNDYHSDGDGGSTVWSKWNAAVAGRIDPTMTGTYVVFMDLSNYEVKSVICRELVGGKDPKTGLYDASETGSYGSIAPYAKQADNVTLNGTTEALPCRMFFIENMNKEVAAAKNGIYIGCYPFSDNVYDSVS